MRQIAFLALTPLGDAILTMAELEELHRLYAPCEITVFAIPLIAELFKNFSCCNHVVVLRGGVHGPVVLHDVPDTVFDAVFNHGYEPWWTDIVRKLHFRKAYGMEEIYRPAQECEELFDRWVPLDYWKNITTKKYQLATQQMAELIRLVRPDYDGGIVRLSRSNYAVADPAGMPRGRYVLFLPGTSAAFKHYPGTKFLALAAGAREMGVEAVFAIGPQDRQLGEALRREKLPIFESLPLNELAGLICGASLVVGNDSGPMHFAAVFDRPTIHLFSFSGAETWFVHEKTRHRLLMPDCGRRTGLSCGPCVRTCIGKIAVSDVLAEMADLLGGDGPRLRRIAYFPQERIGDVLVWANHLEALARFYAPCETVVFGTAFVKSFLEGLAFVDRFVVYDEKTSWTEEEIASFGTFDAVFNTRYDADSLVRVASLPHGRAYGFENVDIPEADCRRHYDGHVPLLRWDDFHFRRETSVTEQGAELIRLVEPDYHCTRVEWSESTYLHEFVSEELQENRRVLFVLGASGRFKHWGTEKYLALAERVKAMGLDVTFLLGPGERDHAPEIEAKGFVVQSDLPFARIAALMNAGHRTACVVGNDTGLMHFACILGVPSVTVMPHGTHFTWFPYGDDPRAPHVACCPACAGPTCAMECRESKACVEKIGVDEVWQQVERIMDVGERRP